MRGKKREKRRTDGDECEEQCKRVGGDDIWIGDARG
jgi:hypothetical protein